MNGNITLGGNITWGAGSSPTQCVYARTALTKPNNNTKYPDGFDDSLSTAWHLTPHTDDKYVSYTYDGGTTWTVAV
jgi:hypothetical protein